MSASENSKEEQINESPDKDFWSVLGMTFSTVFLAELGDKTQIATLMLSAESGKPPTDSVVNKLERVLGIELLIYPEQEQTKKIIGTYNRGMTLGDFFKQNGA